MQQGLFLFTWPDWYFLDIELQKRQLSFAEKFWKENICYFTDDSVSVEALVEALQWGWLFSTKKLIICKWVPEDKVWSWKAPKHVTEFLEKFLWAEEIMLSPDILLVFVSIDPDKRLKLYKTLAEKATVKSFPALSDWQLTTFLQQKLWEYFTQDLADYMIAYVGNNLFRMSQEADKIVTFLQYTNQKTLSNTDRDAIIYTPIQVNAFGVLDAILEDKLENAMSLIDASAQSMTARPEFLWMLYWGLKHMIQTVDVYSRGTTSAKDIGAEIWIHFFPIVKNIKYIKYLQSHQSHLQKIFHEFLMLDKNIKSGLFPQEWFWAEIKKILYQNLSSQ